MIPLSPFLVDIISHWVQLHCPESRYKVPVIGKYLSWQLLAIVLQLDLRLVTRGTCHDRSSSCAVSHRHQLRGTLRLYHCPGRVFDSYCNWNMSNELLD
jgi:hypothetical protein